MCYKLAELDQHEKMSVEAYNREFHKGYARWHLDEPEEIRAYDYLWGLRRNIQINLKNRHFILLL